MVRDIADAIETRIKSPLFGYYLFSVVAINWDPLFYLIVDIGSAASRIKYFHENTDLLSLFIYPFLLSALYSLIYPWLQYLFIYAATAPTGLRNMLQAQSEHNLLAKKQDLEAARNRALKMAEEELIDRAKRDEELNEIEDENVREKLQSEIDALRAEKDAMSKASSKSNVPELTAEQNEMLEFITNQGGSCTIGLIIEKSKYDKIKTEYLVEDLTSKKYLEKVSDRVRDVISYRLTTKSKKLMIDRGLVK